VAANPSQYSFVDVYRLALAGPGAAGLAPASAAESTVRVAASTPPTPQFAVAEAREPRLWMLLLAGLAAAVWVARRRLGIRVLMRRACQLAALALLAALSGCERASAFKPGTQVVVAKVNGVEISARDATTQALEKIIDRELLVQKALAAGLDRDPQVAQSIDQARRHLLAQAYLDRAAAAVPRSTPEEVRAFYAEEPGRFSPSGASTGCASSRCVGARGAGRRAARRSGARSRPRRGRGLAAGARRALHQAPT
jgi:hypothetical protein